MRDGMISNEKRYEIMDAVGYVISGKAEIKMHIGFGMNLYASHDDEDTGAMVKILPCGYSADYDEKVAEILPTGMIVRKNRDSIRALLDMLEKLALKTERYLWDEWKELD